MLLQIKMILKGHRGIVEIKKINNRLIAVKKPLTKFYDGKEEAKFLKLLNKYNIGPKLISYDEKLNELTMEFIEGKRIQDYFETSSKKEIIKQIELILIQLNKMDQLGINKLELTNPYKHIIITKKGPIMIDFERCHYTENPKNMTQFIQYLCSGRITYIFEKKKILVDKDKLREIAKNYKKNQNKKYLKEIIKELN